MKDQLDALINQMIEHGVYFEDAVTEFQRRFIQNALARNNGNKSKTAESLGIHRNTLSRVIGDVHLNNHHKRGKGSR
ncbi:MAG TPA: helix-turn-helix domain-containing protein [Terriglobia bacterium]|nr:helix-turn-helix domain-containing protein [Terriglobia bacterium]